MAKKKSVPADKDDLKAALKDFKAKADVIVQRIAVDRDKLRDLIYEYENIVDCGMDRLSELL